MGILTTLISGALNYGANAASQRQSYELNEKAAQNADQRTRQLFHDLYSPQAQVGQLQDAGLSTGLMYAKGGVGGSGQAGAQAAPAQSQVGNLFDLMNARLVEAQIKNVEADTNKKNVEAKGTEANTRKTDTEIQTMLMQQGLIELNKDYQALCNDIKTFEKVFVQETTEINIQKAEQELFNLVEAGNKLAAEAKSAGADAIVAQSTIQERIVQATQQVTLNKMQIAVMKSGIKLNDATIAKINADVFNNAAYLKLSQAKNEQEIEAIKQQMINDCEKIILSQKELNLKEKEFVRNSIVSAFDVWNRAISNGIGFIKVAGDLAK